MVLPLQRHTAAERYISAHSKSSRDRNPLLIGGDRELGDHRQGRLSGVDPHVFGSMLDEGRLGVVGEQAVEVVAITMAVYLTISLVTSLFMNIYNKRMALVER